eukprot:CAMPEP_0119101526 /NCGR_PEP_ID=MMETSP1180-20130426/567_1 /TAXON_ID=3052 ORGANISM="Chlamydomonas cf sp, Strain CCMP681" /NCGR_SAMPLE_ID=MMETSP1180 /ASSEMBLY_ACC=CAM_ASM_000741 /LENGTH=51 /DNA_ID=CAMNT_0007085665 /DNA_START=1635 /DNA_END=1787 /DNA_ORIENTATION=-
MRSEQLQLDSMHAPVAAHRVQPHRAGSTDLDWPNEWAALAENGGAADVTCD